MDSLKKFKRSLKDQLSLLGYYRQLKHIVRNTQGLEVVSMGDHCLTASVIKNLGLKQKSYPFDWIFSDIRMVNHCIHDEFSTFLDKSQHIKIADSDKLSPDANFCDHRYYKEHYGVLFTFNHYDISVDDVYKYYKRCVERFVELLNSDKKVLFLCISQKICQNDFYELSKTLSLYKNKYLLALNFIQREDDLYTCNISAETENALLYSISRKESIDGTNFQTTQDLISFMTVFCSFLATQKE
ncbi:hypothetical protein APT_00315 [Acetobacter pasteurianus NBRC 101655]|uniref:DUF1796 family putative cysteine peptidase n=1 Tax=Acetobacter pasteurianus TaxID=438 RepID=UPI0002458234|nr:DUF1796 family putative cysteine peptidase [Acetobacter pasteurianus]BAU37397.1 hypothetical protein APT_00315 [Acetobacter pasteurianus NBRC 101655]CCT59900.1 hypothetical protein APA386B_1830 [Acetobacter pasteurianus 386B]